MQGVLNGSRLRYEMMRRGVDQRTLARLAGISEFTLSRAACGRGVRPTTLQAIATALMKLPVVDTQKLVQEAT